MASERKKKGIEAFLLDFSYSYPFSREFLSFFLVFYGRLFKPLSGDRRDLPEPHPMSMFDCVMINLNFILLNGFLMAVPYSFILGIPFRLEYIFGFGTGYFIARDLIEHLFWKHMRAFARSFKFVK